MKLGVIIAFNEEIGRLSNYAEIRTFAGVPYAETKLGGKPAVLAISGQGKENAASCVQLLVSHFGCDVLLNIGLSGSTCSLPVGGVVLVEKAFYHDFDKKIAAETPPCLDGFDPDPVLVGKAENILREMGLTYRRGILATGDIFVEDRAVKADIVARTGCSCVDMEGGAVGHIAYKNGVPYCLVKIISDNAEETARDIYHDTIDIGDYITVSTGFIRRFAESL